MRYQAVNEIAHFQFKDAVIQAVNVDTKNRCITFTLEAVIVTPENSQNENYTYSYASELQMRMTGAAIQKAVKEGYKYYDANDVLVEEVPDTPLSVLELDALLKRLPGTYFWNMTRIEDAQNQTGHQLYLAGIDFGDEENTTYWLQIEFDRIVMEWERYLNRVEM